LRADKEGRPPEHHDGGEYCPRYARWKDLRARKSDLYGAASLAPEDERMDMNDPTAEVEQEELLKLIDERLPVEMRRPFLCMRGGQHVPKAIRDQVEVKVRVILAESGVELPADKKDRWVQDEVDRVA
jgi:hypothetical protein